MEELLVEDLPVTEEYMPPYEGDRVPTLSQLPSQEVENEAEAQNRTSFRRLEALERALKSR